MHSLLSSFVVQCEICSMACFTERNLNTNLKLVHSNHVFRHYMLTSNFSSAWYFLQEEDDPSQCSGTFTKSLKESALWTKMEQEQQRQELGAAPAKQDGPPSSTVLPAQLHGTSSVRRAVYIELSNTALDLGRLYSICVAPCCGAVSSFIGTTRDTFDGRAVSRLEYEVYGKMAEAKMASIAFAAMDRWRGLRRVVMSHRSGEVGIGCASVVIHVSSVHRPDGLEAVKYLIDTLKADVPIWKREFYVVPGSAVAAAAAETETGRRQREEEGKPGCGSGTASNKEVSAWKANSECCGRHKKKEIE